MRILARLVLAWFCISGLAVAQFGGHDGDVVLYAVSTKGDPRPVAVTQGTGSNQRGFQVVDPLTATPIPFGPDFAGEFFVNLHNEDGDNFRFIIQKEDIATQTNEFLGPGKVLIVKGMDRLLIPNKTPVDLVAGLYAPFPQGTDFGPELPIIEANSFLWTPAPFFPLLAPRPAGFIGPANRTGKTGSEYVLDLGTFVALLHWFEFRDLYGTAWQRGIHEQLIEADPALGSTAKLIRLREGRKTPPFIIRANTHLAVLSGSVQIIPASGPAVTLTKDQYAFVPNGYSIVLANPSVYDGPTQ
jgi:hypothetical protein